MSTKTFTAEFKKHVVEELFLPENRKNTCLIAISRHMKRTAALMQQFLLCLLCLFTPLFIC